MAEKKTPSWVGILFLVGIWILLFGVGDIIWVREFSSVSITALSIGIILLGISLTLAWTYQKRRKHAKT